MHRESRRTPTRRALAATLVLLAACALGGRASAGVPGKSEPLVIASSSLRATGAQLEWTLRTVGPWHPSTLARPGRAICLELAMSTPKRRRTLLCVTRGAPHRIALRLTPALPAGRARRLHATLTRPNARTLIARFTPSAAGIVPGTVRWRARTAWTPDDDCPGTAPAHGGACISRAPAGGSGSVTAPSPQPLGCTRAGASFRTAGNPGKRVVALTFDDGPGPYTPQVLSVLERARVPATFFLVGIHIADFKASPRRALADGDALGDHTFHHVDVAGAGPLAAQEIGSTRKLIERATGYAPCLFRAPFGSTSPALIALAAGMGMATIQWSVDPSDYRRPGAAAIEQRVLSAVRPGGIVLMHDGGGDRSQTVAALPHIIDTLRARGYRFATVPGLLGFHVRF